MAIGTSNGEYFKDEYELAAKQTSEKPVISSSEEPNQVMSDADERPIAGEQYAMMEGRNRLPLPSEGGVGGEIDKLATGAAPGPGKITMKPGPETGYRSKKFTFHDEEGTKVGDMRISQRGQGLKDLYVEGIYAKEGPQAFGFSATRDLVRQIKEHYPDAERLYGLRVSGARNKVDPKTGEAQGHGSDYAYLALKPGVKAQPPGEDQYRDALVEQMRVRNREYQMSRTQGGAPSNEELYGQVPFSEADFARNYTAGDAATRRMVDEIMATTRPSGVHTIRARTRPTREPTLMERIENSKPVQATNRISDKLMDMESRKARWMDRVFPPD